MTSDCLDANVKRRLRPIAELWTDLRGSNAVEFALIAPVLMFVVMGIICAALYLAMMNSLAQVAADTARYAMIGLDPAERAKLARAWVSDQEHR